MRTKRYWAMRDIGLFENKDGRNYV
jgi:hypothetical protein